MSLNINFPPISSLVELLSFRAKTAPERELYTFLLDGENEEVHLTAAELDRQARTIGALLQNMGKQGEKVLLLYPPGLEYIAAFFGCLYAGAIAVPAYPPDPQRLSRTLPRLQSIITDCQASVILTTEMIHSMAEFIFNLAPDLQKLKWVATDQLHPQMAEEWHPPSLSAENTAFLQYTSGSTGKPKGVILSHQNLLHNLQWIAERFENTPEGRGVIWLPPYHDMGLIGGILQPLYAGSFCVLMSPLHFLQRPLRWLKAISRYRATDSGGPNFAYEMCLKKITEEQRATLDLSSWALAFCGAETIRFDTFHRFAERFGVCGFREEAFYPCYGLAEGTLMVSGGKKGSLPQAQKILKQELQKHRVQEGDAEVQTIVGCGQSLADQTLLIVDAESFNPCKENQVGEVWVKGPSVAQGYWNRSEETDQIFKAYLRGHEKEGLGGPFLRTGDLGFLKDKELFITGRLKDLIIVRGQNHYPQDIEHTLEQRCAFLRAGCGAVFSVEKEGEEKLVVVYEVEENPGHHWPILDIRQSITTHHELEVDAIVLVKKGSIPKTSSGKISRVTCRENFLEGKLEVLAEWKKSLLSLRPEPNFSHDDKTGKGSEAIKNWLVQKLILQFELSPAHIDFNKPITSYGLDSKDAINLSGELEEWLGKTFSPSLIWKYPTIESLSAYLASEVSTER